MKLIFTITAFILLSVMLTAQPVKIMLVTGGHAFDTLQFLNVFGAMEEVEYMHYNQPQANRAIAAGDAGSFDVLVFYDMWQDISEAEKEAYIKLTKQGKPLLFLHHALVSYQHWPAFMDLLGGRYVENSKLKKEQQSNYRHDVWIDVEVVDPKHPVTRGIDSFKIYDEVYGNYIVQPKVKPLLITNHPESTPVIGWENTCNASTIIYLQPGHDKNTFEAEPYRRLIKQAIRYLAGR